MRKIQFIGICLALLVLPFYVASWSFEKGTSSVDFTPHGTQPGLQFEVQSASQCSGCHGETTQQASDLNYLPYAGWAGSMMANAARDPLFWAALDVANQDIPGVGEFCIRCHTPSGFYQGHVKNLSGDLSYANGCELTGDPIQPDNQLNDYQGINCHFCHRVDPQGPESQPLILKNSNIWLDDEKCDNPDSVDKSEPCRKGSYSPPVPELHTWEASAFIQSSQFCGTCHNVSSPEVKTNGVLAYAKTLMDTGVDTQIAMPFDKTYDEWKHSEFADLIFRDQFSETLVSTNKPALTKGQTCQDCHMPQSMDPNARASHFTALGSRTGDLAVHSFAGANSWMPQVLKAIYGSQLDAISGFSRTDAFDRATQSALDMLKNQSAEIETSLVSIANNKINLQVKVTNLTGHKLPTGYHEGRRMWIHLLATDANGQTLYESGAYDAVSADLTLDSSTKVYETTQGIWNAQSNSCETESNGKKVFHFVLNDCIAKDNRIPPLGFRGADNVELKPVNANFAIDNSSGSQRLVNYDVTNYTISTTATTAFPVSVKATLKYQTTSKEYIDFLANQNNHQSENNLCNRNLTVGPANQNRGDFMKTLWQNNGKSAPVDMVHSTLEVTSQDL